MPAGPARKPLRRAASGGTSSAALLPPRRSPADLALAVGLAVAGLALGWCVLTNAMADRLARTAPAAALTWDEEHAGALAELAERSLLAGEAEAATEFARHALARDALQIRAIRVLGLAAESQGDRALAGRLLANAGARSRRDTPTQAWLFDHATARGDYAEAFARADALVRDQPAMASRVYPVMITLAGRPGARGPLAARLATNPPWRAAFVQTWIRQAPDADGPLALLDQLPAAGSPPTDIERQAMVSRLVRDRRVQQAFVLWVQGLPRSELMTLRDVRDGGFEGSRATGAFSWSIERPGRAVAEFVEAPGHEGRTLHLTFQGAPAPEAVIRQLLVLPPGLGVLSGEVRADRLDAVEGLVWTIQCAGVGHQMIATSPAIADPTPWRRFQVAFETPASDCEAQWLTLGALGRTAGARRMSGEVWYDNIEVSR